MQTISLSNSLISVDIDSFGAGLTSIKDAHDTQYLWQGDEAYWSGQAPILFPIVGCLRNGTASFLNGKRCNMGRHGIARRQPFQLVSSNDNTATFSLRANEETLSDYPFDFELQITYELDGPSVNVIHKVMNHGNEDLPFFVGGHPAFNCPVYNNETFEDYIVQFSKKETASCAQLNDDALIVNNQRVTFLEDSDTIPMEHSLFSNDALVFDTLKSREVSLIHKDTKRGICLSFDGFDYLGVWSSANNGPFVALEPWTGTATLTSEDDIFEHKRNVHILSAGENETLCYTIGIV